MKRFAAMLAVSVLMVLWIASGDRMSAGQRTDGLYYEVTGIHPDAVLMRINGEDISAEEYLYWLAYDCEYLTSYVPNLDFSAEVSNGMTYGSYAKADAVETVKLYALLRQWAKQYNVSLTEEDEARLQQQRQQYVTYYGGEEGCSCWASARIPSTASTGCTCCMHGFTICIPPTAAPCTPRRRPSTPSLRKRAT